MIVGGLCLLLSCRTHWNPAEILSFHSELTEPHLHLIWRQYSTKRKENTILLKYKHPARNDKVTVFPKIEKQLTFLSAVNRRTAQHFKAKTKQHKREIMAREKRQKCLFTECLARLFLNYTFEQVIYEHSLRISIRISFVLRHDRDFHSSSEDQAGAGGMYALWTDYCGCTLRVWQRSSSMQSVRDGGRQDDTFLHQ